MCNSDFEDNFIYLIIYYILSLSLFSGNSRSLQILLLLIPILVIQLIPHSFKFHLSLPITSYRIKNVKAWCKFSRVGSDLTLLKQLGIKHMKFYRCKS